MKKEDAGGIGCVFVAMLYSDILRGLAETPSSNSISISISISSTMQQKMTEYSTQLLRNIEKLEKQTVTVKQFFFLATIINRGITTCGNIGRH